MRITTSQSMMIAEKLAAELRRIGFVEGPPSHIAPEVVDIDRRIYSRLKCGECGHRGHKVTPTHRGREYRLLCRCRKCGNDVPREGAGEVRQWNEILVVLSSFEQCLAERELVRGDVSPEEDDGSPVVIQRGMYVSEGCHHRCL